MSKTPSIDTIRAMMPVVNNKVYLNTGSVGPMSIIGQQALLEADIYELQEGRGTTASYESYFENKAQLKERFATLVNCDVGEIALTHHTTEGMNIATLGVDWARGDEVITTNLEHPGGLVPLYIVSQRFGVNIRVVEIEAEDSAETIVAKFAQAITPRTRMLSFSHVAWNLGITLPLKKLCDLARKHHILTIVDAAQSIGAIPLDLPASGVDYYAMTGQKWLCGPQGIGALYVRKASLGHIRSTFGGYLTLKDFPSQDFGGYYVPKPDASRFEVGTTYRPAIFAMKTHLEWLEREIGWAWIYKRIRKLHKYTKQTLAEVDKLRLITPKKKQAGLVTFALDGYDPNRVVTRLYERGIVIRSIYAPASLRASVGFYNNENDVDHLAEALAEITAGDPDDLPEFIPAF